VGRVSSMLLFSARDVVLVVVVVVGEVVSKEKSTIRRTNNGRRDCLHHGMCHSPVQLMVLHSFRAVLGQQKAKNAWFWSTVFLVAGRSRTMRPLPALTASYILVSLGNFRSQLARVEHAPKQ
jgi:hypothetical protein